MEHLDNCTYCPHNCHVNRHNERKGFCKTDDSFNIASICIHTGEEPPISGPKGICNVFFTNCNLQCIYCQNYQISDNTIDRSHTKMTLPDVVSRITSLLNQEITHVGFVSPSHCIPQMKAIIKEINNQGYHPVWVYNTNGYDKVETLKSLEGIIDVYLPDLKYLESNLSAEYSRVPNYPEVAAKALKEMFRQKGSSLILDDEDKAISGIIVRHLVLPGYTENSLNVIRFLATELSPKIHVSLMSQYYPTPKVSHHPFLGSRLDKTEFEKVVKEMEKLGIDNGWIQEFESSDLYQPDFKKDHPFEQK
ncbi:MAG: 4Fe-4S cluster-binding domain-containing protein [Bacteroidales bacterium]|nr:4Fe-4S cluster-binding domain-containing protein [Bacteroidales bacterium]